MGKSVRNAESSRNKKETKEKNIKRERKRSLKGQGVVL